MPPITVRWSSGAETLLKAFGLALVVGAGYYIGTAVGLALKLPNATPSVV